MTFQISHTSNPQRFYIEGLLVDPIKIGLICRKTGQSNKPKVVAIVVVVVLL